jgi:hypothetical protein
MMHDAAVRFKALDASEVVKCSILSNSVVTLWCITSHGPTCFCSYLPAVS